jgi:CHAT domain-containing protein
MADLDCERRMSLSGQLASSRALVLCGVQSQVVGLWNVNVAATVGLTGEFYGELVRGTGRAERCAGQAALAAPAWVAHLYYWAAFIPAGDRAPLTAGTMRRQEAP